MSAATETKGKAHAVDPQACAEAAIALLQSEERPVPLHGLNDGKCNCGGRDGCHPGKHPRFGGWQSKRYTEDALRRMWSNWPVTNLGRVIQAGEIELDIDDEIRFVASTRHLMPLPATVAYRTGHGGGRRHLRFAVPRGLKFRSVIDGAQILAEGGLAVIPPSVTLCRYEYFPGCAPREISVASLPEDWLTFLSLPRKSEKDDVGVKPQAPIPDADVVKRRIAARAREEAATPRHRHLANKGMALQLRDNRIPLKEAESVVTQFADDVRNKGTHAFTRAEALGTLLDIYRTPPRERWAGSSKGVPTDGAVEPLPVMHVGDLLRKKFPTNRWVWRLRLRMGGVSLLVGKPKVGKTTFELELAVRVAHGERFLNWSTQKGPVVLLLLEEHEAEVRRILRRLGATENDPIHLVIATDVGPNGVARLRRTIQDLKPILVIVDSLFDLMTVGSDSGSGYAPVRQAMRPFMLMARELGVHIMLVHHGVKSRDQIGMDNALGSTALFGSVDTGIRIWREADRYFLETDQRYPTGVPTEVRNVPKTELLLDPEPGTLSLGETASHIETERIERQIADFLSNRNGWIVRTAIEDEVTGNTTVVRRVLKSMYDSDKVRRRGRGVKGNPHEYAAPTGT